MSDINDLIAHYYDEAQDDPDSHEWQAAQTMERQAAEIARLRREKAVAWDAMSEHIDRAQRELPARHLGKNVLCGALDEIARLRAALRDAALHLDDMGCEMSSRLFEVLGDESEVES